jgi:2-polyprenyl-3-methyl-5-hydroxy-6-metoxy-1,4-benzoquinol methylase
MLPRVLEPEVMDTPEEAVVYDRMDHSDVNARFVADFLALHGPARGGLVLDVGTGTAQIPIRLCQVDPAARVLAIDLARHMLDQAAVNLAAAGLSGRIRLELADAKALAQRGETFEAVISNSIVHHIPEPAALIAALPGRVAPGGTLFVRDLARPATLPELDSLVARYAGGEADHARRLFAESLHAALTLDEVRDLVAVLGLPREDVQMTSDRHWTWAWQNR